MVQSMGERHAKTIGDPVRRVVVCLSAFQDETHGFVGYERTDEQLQAVNSLRHKRGEGLLEQSPGLRLPTFRKTKSQGSTKMKHASNLQLKNRNKNAVRHQ